MELSGEVRTEENIIGPVHMNVVWRLHRGSHMMRSLVVRRECLYGLAVLSVDLPFRVQNPVSFVVAAHL